MEGVMRKTAFMDDKEQRSRNRGERRVGSMSRQGAPKA